MNKQGIVFKRVVWLLLIVVTLPACSSPSEKNAQEPGTSSAEEHKPALHSIEITQMRFYPAELKVKKGDKVIFVNHDLVTHDITEESRKAWSSSPLVADQTWMLVVTETVNYFCSIHPVMKGKIVVE